MAKKTPLFARPGSPGAGNAGQPETTEADNQLVSDRAAMTARLRAMQIRTNLEPHAITEMVHTIFAPISMLMAIHCPELLARKRRPKKRIEK